MESIADLKEVATKLNPAVGYWDPLKLAEVRLLPGRCARPGKHLRARRRSLLPLLDLERPSHLLIMEGARVHLLQAEFWDNTNEETIGFLRHAEIKHGRIAMVRGAAPSPYPSTRRIGRPDDLTPLSPPVALHRCAGGLRGLLRAGERHQVPVGAVRVD